MSLTYQELIDTIESNPSGVREALELVKRQLAAYPETTQAELDDALALFKADGSGATEKVSVTNLLSRLTVDNYTELQSLNPDVSRSVYILGRSEKGDGGEGHFRWDSSDLSTEVGNDEVTTGEGDGGIYVAPDSDKTGASGAWVRQFRTDAIYSEWYGATPSAAGNDTVPLQKALDAAGRINEDNRTNVVGGSGARVQLLTGEYAIDASLKINKQGVSLVGVSRTATVITQNADVDTILVQGADPTNANGDTDANIIEGYYIAHLQIRRPGPGTNYTAGTGITLDYSGNGLCEDLWIQNFFQPIKLKGSKRGAQFSNIHIRGGGSGTGVVTQSAQIKLERRLVSDGSGSIDPDDSNEYRRCVSVYFNNIHTQSTDDAFNFGLDIEACDGVYFNNGHLGFPVNAIMRLKGVQSNLSILNVHIGDVFFDASDFIGTSRTIWFQDSGKGTVIEDVRFSNCEINTAVDVSFECDEPGCVGDTLFSGCQFTNGDDRCLELNAGSHFTFDGCTYKNFSGTNLFLLEGATDININGGQIYEGSLTTIIVVNGSDRIAVANLQALDFSGNLFNFVTSPDQISLDIDGRNIVSPGKVRRFELGDDQSISFLPIFQTGHFSVAQAGGIERAKGFFNADDASPSITGDHTTSGFDVTTGGLSGTTGTDGNSTISAAADNNIHVENRTGGTLSYLLTVQ